MKKPLKFLQNYKFKTQKRRHKKGGFTLVEILVGLILAFLVITPLLGFMVSTMTSDRQEQAKSASEQEIQTALDYISRDVSQAIFIYDGFGLQTVSSQLPNPPAGTDGAPVLVFWKREFKPKALPNGDDAFVLSLVAYYLIKDTTCSNNSSWSCTTRIGRVQLNDAVRDPTDDTKPPIVPASPGFSTPFSTAATTAPGAVALSFEQRMNSWTPAGNLNDPANQVVTLIDYVDQTSATVAGLNPPLCPTDARGAGRPDITTPNATAADLAVPYNFRQTPNFTGTGAAPNSLQTGSFYACVSTDKTLAQVFIRGNSLARNKPKLNPPTYSESQTAYFPKASIQVQGRGLINQN